MKGPLAQANVGRPTVGRVEGEGEQHVVDVEFMAQAPLGINSWAGTSRDGTPLKSMGELPSSKGIEAERSKAIDYR